MTILQFCPAPDYVSGRIRTQRPSWFGPRRAGVQTGVHTQTYAEICTEDPRKILALLNYFCAEWIGRSTLRNSAWACNVQPTAQFLTECHLSCSWCLGRYRQALCDDAKGHTKTEYGVVFRFPARSYLALNVVVASKAAKCFNACSGAMTEWALAHAATTLCALHYLTCSLSIWVTQTMGYTKKVALPYGGAALRCPMPAIDFET